jgi:hypothetical protein
MLQWNQASLEAQTDDDWEQILLVDDVGRGVPWANRNLADNRERARGAYVWILDDDDEATDTTLVTTLKELAQESDPDLVMVKMDHGTKIGIQPDKEHWLKRPVHSYCGVSAVIAKNGLWQEAIKQFGAHLGGDIKYAQAAYDMAQKTYWLDRVVSRVQRVSWGRPE